MYLFLETVLGLLQLLILSCEGVGGGRGEGVKGWGWEVGYSEGKVWFEVPATSQDH